MTLKITNIYIPIYNDSSIFLAKDTHNMVNIMTDM